MINKIKAREFILLFSIQFCSYGLLCINIRATALANYTQVVSTDFIIASLNYFVIRKISTSAETTHQWLGYALGGAVGSIFGIYLSKILLGS